MRRFYSPMQVNIINGGSQVGISHIFLPHIFPKISKNYMIYIAFLQHPDLKKKKKEKKKKVRPTDPPYFQAKRANKPFFLGLMCYLVLQKPNKVTRHC